MPNILRLRHGNEDSSFACVSDLMSARVRARHVERSLGHVTEKSFLRTEYYCRSFASEFGGVSPNVCGNDELLDWLSEHPQWKSPSTRINAVAEVIAAFEWASTKHKTRYGHFARRKLKLAKPIPRTPITQKEFTDLMWFARFARGSRKSKLALREGCYFLWETGARTCEMFTIEAKHVDWERSCVVLGEHKTADVTGDLRTIYLPRGVRLLLKFLAAQRPTGPLFRNGWGRPWCCVTFARLFRRYGQLAGIRPEVSPYSIRHAFCVRSLNANNGDRQTADLMGQSSTHYVKWYGKTAKGNIDYLKSIREKF